MTDNHSFTEGISMIESELIQQLHVQKVKGVALKAKTLYAYMYARMYDRNKRQVT